jgi:hypothetical protein
MSLEAEDPTGAQTEAPSGAGVALRRPFGAPPGEKDQERVAEPGEASSKVTSSRVISLGTDPTPSRGTDPTPSRGTDPTPSKLLKTGPRYRLPVGLGTHAPHVLGSVPVAREAGVWLKREPAALRVYCLTRVLSKKSGKYNLPHREARFRLGMHSETYSKAMALLERRGLIRLLKPADRARHEAAEWEVPRIGGSRDGYALIPRRAVQDANITNADFALLWDFHEYHNLEPTRTLKCRAESHGMDYRRAKRSQAKLLALGYLYAAGKGNRRLVFVALTEEDVAKLSQHLAGWKIRCEKAEHKGEPPPVETPDSPFLPASGKGDPVATFLALFRRRGLRCRCPCPAFTTEDYGIAASLLKKYSYRKPWEEGPVCPTDPAETEWRATIITGPQEARYIYGNSRKGVILTRTAMMKAQPTELEELTELFWCRGTAPFVEGYPYAMRLFLAYINRTGGSPDG